MTQGERIKSLIDEFPDAATKTLARIAVKRWPSQFMSVEKARGAVRYARGNKGTFLRGHILDKSRIRPNGAPGDPFGAIPEGLVHFEDWQAVEFKGPIKALVLADVHIPYHDRSAVMTALEYGRKRGADFILGNGDIADFFSVSFWEKDPTKRNFIGELQSVRDFFKALRSGFQKARIVMKLGNHEERFERYMVCKAPELFNVPEFKADRLMHLDSIGAECVGEKRPIRLGQLNVLHGHEYNFAISNPVNPARGLFLRSKCLCLGSHFHQTSQHSEKNLEEKVISTWSTGCLCDLHPDYRPLNPWNHGFAFIEVAKDGAFQIDNIKIIHGKVY